MEDDSSNKDVEENLQRKSFSEIFNVRNVLQPIRVRYNSISALLTNREFVVRKFSFVLHFGTLLWTVFLLTKIF